MSFVPKYNAEWRLRFFPKKASTTLTYGMAVIQDSGTSGRIAPATTSTDLVCGIIQTSVASSDATTSVVPVLIPILPQATFIVDTASQATAGTTVDIASGALSVDPGASTEDVVTITKALSSTLAEGFFNTPAPTRA